MRRRGRKEEIKGGRNDVTYRVFVSSEHGGMYRVFHIWWYDKDYSYLKRRIKLFVFEEVKRNYKSSTGYFFLD